MLLVAPMHGEALTAKVPIAFWTIVIHIWCPARVAALRIFMLFLKHVGIIRVRLVDDNRWSVRGAFFNGYRARFIMWRVVAGMPREAFLANVPLACSTPGQSGPFPRA